MTEAILQSLIQWELVRKDFRNSIRQMIHECQEHDKVIPLPIPITPGRAFLHQLALLITNINCDNCNAPCCKANPRNELFSLIPGEYERLAAKFGKRHFIHGEHGPTLPMPCPFCKPFVKSTHDDDIHYNCQIYEDRPFICRTYPFQPGGTASTDHIPVLALDSTCPESRRVALSIFMTMWSLRHGWEELGDKATLKRFVEESR